MDSFKKAISAIEKHLTSKEKERLTVLFERLVHETNKETIREIDFILEEAETRAIEKAGSQPIFWPNQNHRHSSYAKT